jgi:hypothetical protein
MVSQINRYVSKKETMKSDWDYNHNHNHNHNHYNDSGNDYGDDCDGGGDCGGCDQTNWSEKSGYDLTKAFYILLKQKQKQQNFALSMVMKNTSYKYKLHQYNSEYCIFEYVFLDEINKHSIR